MTPVTVSTDGQTTEEQIMPLQEERPEHRIIRQLEDQVIKLISAESALLRITNMLGIIVELGDDGRYDADALRDQVIDAIERRQAGGSV